MSVQDHLGANFLSSNGYKTPSEEEIYHSLNFSEVPAFSQMGRALGGCLSALLIVISFQLKIILPKWHILEWCVLFGILYFYASVLYFCWPKQKWPCHALIENIQISYCCEFNPQTFNINPLKILSCIGNLSALNGKCSQALLESW